MSTNKFEDWLNELVDALTLRAEYYFYHSTDIELDREKFRHFTKEDLTKAISSYNTDDKR